MDRPRNRKSSARITLVLIGTTALTGCGDSVSSRDVYVNRPDCVRDWGDDDRKCEPVRDGHYPSHYYYGPSYGGGVASQTSPRPNSHAVATTHISRGGFGSSAHGHSGGG